MAFVNKRQPIVPCEGSCGNKVRPPHRSKMDYPATVRAYKDGLCHPCYVEKNGPESAPRQSVVNFQAKEDARDAKMEAAVAAGFLVRQQIEADRKRRSIAAGDRAKRVARQQNPIRYGPGLPPPPKATPVYRPSTPQARSES